MLPYGTSDVDPEIVCDPGPPKRVRCYVRGCRHMLLVPGRKHNRGAVCPEHGIRCHHSSAGATYVFADVRQNIIAAADLFAQRVVGHPFKYESHRLGAERSEDALSWNVFRSLYQAKQLASLAQRITGIASRIEPYLYLWGLEINDDCLQPWHLLIEARRRFESNLPVDRPLTEPDIALHLPGKYLLLIEAKFTSSNTFYERGPRRDSRSLTCDELLRIYRDPQLELLDTSKADESKRVFNQLWRNMIFAEWMSRVDHPGTKAYHINLVRREAEIDNCHEFRKLLRPEFADHFQRWTWEQLYELAAGHPSLLRMRQYLETKTAGLRQAFEIA